MKFEVPFIKPSLPHSSEIVEDYEEIIKNNWFTNFGPFENKFKDQVEKYLDNGAHATTVANATLGLDLAIRALIDTEKTRKDQKQVLMPSFTFSAGAEVIISNGLKPVFIDIEQGSLQPSLNNAQEYIKANPGAVAGILLCNIFGVGNVDIKDWELLAARYNLPLIIDTAAGFGSQYDNSEKVGARGDCEVFSLHATKPFAVGEGGIVSSKNESLIKEIRQLQNFGFGPDRRVASIGTNAKMQEMNAAIGIRQLNNFEDRVSARQSVLEQYKAQLPDNYTYQTNDELSTIAFASVVAPDALTAQNAHTNLLENSIEARRYYEPLHFHPILAQRAIIASELIVTEDISNRILSLPVHDDMNTATIKKIANIISKS